MSLQVPTLGGFGVDEQAFRKAVPSMARDALASGSPSNNPIVPDAAQVEEVHTPLCTPRRILRLTVLGRSPRLGAPLSPRACCEWVDGAGADYKEHRGLVLGGLGLGVRLLPDLRPTRCCAGGVGVGAREAHLSENVANYSVNQ